MKKIASWGVAVLALALGLSACGAPPDQPAPGATSAAPGATAAAPSSAAAPAPGANYKACLVSDTGGFSDKSFNEAAKNGVDQAATELGIQKVEMESKNDADYAGNITALLAQNCSLIIATGFNLEKAMVDAAKKNPNNHFAIVDDSPQDAPSNLKPIMFKTSEAGFLAGYAAAGYSPKGKVATFGGMQIPTVTIFMDGFADGVAAYNKDSGKSVKLLGWDKATQKGSFLNSFGDQAAAQNMTQQFISQGADIVMPVAGSAGLGSTGVAKQNGASIVWVDQDGYVTVPDFKDIMLTSVMKGIQPAVYDTIKGEVTAGKFDATPYVGTIANKGVGIAPWHDFDSKLSADLKAKVTDLESQIASGALKITSPADAALGPAGK